MMEYLFIPITPMFSLTQWCVAVKIPSVDQIDPSENYLHSIGILDISYYCIISVRKLFVSYNISLKL